MQAKLQHNRLLQIASFLFLLFQSFHPTSLFSIKLFGDILPGAGPFGLSKIYASTELGLSFPLFLFDTTPKQITGPGSQFRLETGYDWNGWLFGIRLGPILYFANESNDAKLDYFHHFMLGGQISKILDNSLIQNFPEWLAIVPTLGAGMNFIYAQYYQKPFVPSSHTISGSCFYFNLGVYANFLFWQNWIVPYTGTDHHFMLDVDGPVWIAAITIGIRVYPFRVADSFWIGKGTEGSLSIAAKPFPTPFSPDHDGKSDTLKIHLRAWSKSKIKRWSLAIYDPYQNLFRKFEGYGRVPRTIRWDGKSDTGELVQSAMNYPYIYQAEDNEGNTAVHHGTIPVDLLVVREQGKIKILAPSIRFDPNKATFLTLSKEEIQNNRFVLERVVKILKRHPDYQIKIEGHANNVSNTQREELQSLIPLSQQRAQTIKKILIESGIEASRLTAVGMGGRYPIVDHSRREEWWKNRRVEFILIQEEKEK